MKYILTYILLLGSINAMAQLTDFKEIWKNHDYKAESLFEMGLYEAAIDKYNIVLESSPDDEAAILGIARCYKVLGKYDLSKNYYSILALTGSLDSLKDIKDYADVSLSSGNLNDALTAYRQVLTADPENKVIRNKISGIIKWDSLFKDEEYIEVEPVSFNTEHNEFAIRRFKNDLAFTSAREKELIVHQNYLREREWLTDVYILSDKEKSKLLELKGLKSRNDGPFTQFENQVVISRNRTSKLSGRSTLGLFFYRIDENGNLVDQTEFFYNDPVYNVTHPIFNDSGDTLYFVSDMKGGFGGMDIYYSVNKGGQWTPPRNLGEPVNTSENEIFPFIDSGSLYFSSDGHYGLGGYDTYMLAEKDGNRQVVNLGYPLNSSWDDFAIYIEGTEGYISSNDPKGNGGDDIYAFKLLPKPVVVIPDPVQISFIAIDTLNDKHIEGVKITITGENDTLNLTSDQHGNASAEISPGEYLIQAEKDTYIHHAFSITPNEGEMVSHNIWLDPPFAMHSVSPDSIMFKLGEYTLLDAAKIELNGIVETLEEYPNLILEIIAHTDSRGSTEFNQWLSEQRAKAAADYIISQGISNERIIQLGKGESELLNNCKDGVSCSEKFHAVNRRIEFDFHKN